MSENSYNFYHKRDAKCALYREIVYINTGAVLSMNFDMLSLFAYGETCFSANYHTLMETHCFNLEYILEGSMTYSSGQESWNLSPGDVMLALPGTQATFQVTGGKPVRKIFIMVNNNRISSLLFNSGALCNHYHLHLKNPEKFAQKLKNIKHLCQTGGQNQPMELSTAIYSLMMELIFSQARIGDNDQTNFAKKLSLLLDSAISENYSLDYLATYFGVGKRTLNRLFLKYFNCTPIRYLIQKRMEYAAGLLLHSNTPVGNIASECGYSDPAFFSREFTRYHGLSPLNYRKKKQAALQA